jgi:hypothetical protein
VAAAATSTSSHNSSFDSTLNSGSVKSSQSSSSSPLVNSTSSAQVQHASGNTVNPLLAQHNLLYQHQNHHHTSHHSHHTSTSSSSSSSLKRKRKNRTAFTANQIFELEKRFSNQRYLSPHDRDRIAAELSLSTAQVITWFQNRRAKQKRDIEEMKNDVTAAKSLKIIDSDIDVDKVVIKYDSFTKLPHQQSSYPFHHHHGIAGGFGSHPAIRMNRFDCEDDDDNEDSGDQESELDIDTNSRDDSTCLSNGNDESTTSIDNNSMQQECSKKLRFK